MEAQEKLVELQQGADGPWVTKQNIYNTAKRLVNRAGLSRIDHSITTHWHRDHFGGLGEISRRVPIQQFYDRGIPDKFPDDPEMFAILMENYRKASGDKSHMLHAGDRISLEQPAGAPGLRMQCVAGNREVIQADAGAPDNPLCGESEPRPVDESDNANSLVFLLTFGEFQFFDGGDITWNIEHDLVCPKNAIGRVDLYMVNHHGFDISNNPVFVKSIAPTVAVVCNGPQKGASPKVIALLKSLSGLQALYQLHRNVQTRDEENTNPAYIANPDPTRSGQYIKASVAEDGR